MSGALLDELFNAVNPSLVRTFGANRAIILQAIHFASGAIGNNGSVQATQTDIAWRTGLTRTVVCRNLAVLEQKGFVHGESDTATGVKTYYVDRAAVVEASAPAHAEFVRRSQPKQLVPNRTSSEGSLCETAQTLCETAQADIYIEKEIEEEGRGGDAAPPSGPLDDPEYEPYRNAARWVLNRWAEANNRPPQKITVKAVEDMRLLMQRGPTNWATPAEVTGQEIRDVTAAALADPFWRQQIQSPGNLRKHWDRLAQLPTTKPTGPTGDETIQLLINTYNTIGNREGWNAMLAALPDDRHRAIADAVGMRAFGGELVALQIAIRQQLKAAA